MLAQVSADDLVINPVLCCIELAKTEVALLLANSAAAWAVSAATFALLADVALFDAAVAKFDALVDEVDAALSDACAAFLYESAFVSLVAAFVLDVNAELAEVAAAFFDAKDSAALVSASSFAFNIELSFVYNERVANSDYGFLQYADLMNIILSTKCKVLKKNEVNLIWYLHGIRSGVFLFNDVLEYPNNFRKRRSRVLINILLHKGIITTLKKHSRINPNVYIFTKEFKAILDEIYKIGMCMKEVPINEEYLGDFYHDPSVLKLCLKQKDDVKTIKETYLKFRAKKR